MTQPEQEPVVGITAIRTWFKDGRVVTQTLCNSWVDTTPPQRTWVGLTDKEILADDVLRYHFGLNGGAGPVSKSGRKIVDALEARLKEKNK